MGSKTITVPFSKIGMWRTRTLSIPAQSKSVTFADSSPAPGATITAACNALHVKAPVAASQVLRGATFTVGASRYVQDATGNLLRDPSAATGVATVAGTLAEATGDITLSDWPALASGTIGDFRGVQMPPTEGLRTPFASSNVTFRTAAAPIRPGSLQLLGSLADGTAINITAGTDGKINAARVKGLVNYETGLIELWFVNPDNVLATAAKIDLTSLGIAGVGVLALDLAKTSTLRYNAVAYTYLPLSADILGLDPVRLPQDGRVPVFKAGRVVVIHNTQRMAPVAVSNGQAVSTGRTRLARLRVFGSDGAEISVGFTPDLDAGTVTFNAVAGYSQPVTVEHRIEDEALCAEAQITGDIRLTRPLTHDFPVPGTFVSSALIVGDLQASATESFSQSTWTSVWQDSIIGSPIAAQYNQALNPIAVTNRGAIEESWALIFTNSTQFRVVGKEVGEILQSNTGELCAPVNPATGVPYFSIPAAGWGSGWAAGNVLRFSTRAANFPLWCVRTVLQSAAAAPGTDQIVISIRGDINV